MKIEDIYKSWEEDNSFDIADLSGESANIPKLHNKYFVIYIEEGMRLKKLREDFKQFKQHKADWYTGKMAPEDIKDYGWEPGPGRNYLKQEIPGALDSDPDVINFALKIGTQELKVEYLESIIKMINNRGFQIKSIIDFERFKAGLS